MMRYSKSPRRSLPGFAVDMALRDMRKGQPDPLIAEMLKALRKAEEFIVNGVELGFIRLPDPETPDPAHQTLPAIRAAIKSAEAR